MMVGVDSDLLVVLDGQALPHRTMQLVSKFRDLQEIFGHLNEALDTICIVTVW